MLLVVIALCVFRKQPPVSPPSERIRTCHEVWRRNVFPDSPSAAGPCCQLLACLGKASGASTEGASLGTRGKRLSIQPPGPHECLQQGQVWAAQHQLKSHLSHNGGHRSVGSWHSPAPSHLSSTPLPWGLQSVTASSPWDVLKEQRGMCNGQESAKGSLVFAGLV